MKLHFMVVPVYGGEAEAAELDRFLSSHRVLDVQRHLIGEGASSAWAISVSYVDGAQATASSGSPGKKAPRVDYREVLSEEDFRVFSKLRALRKAISEEEGVPLYAVFTNEQLAAMVQGGFMSLADLQALEGVGPARTEKYGARFLAVVRGEAAASGVTNGTP